jgi:tetratricopeptide (TPR) repeat protein
VSSGQARQLLERGIEAARAGRKDEARKLLQQSLRLDPQSDSAWLWLASVISDKRERLVALQRSLEINPANEMALKAVRALGIDPAQWVRPAQPSTPAEPMSGSLAADDATAEGPGIPLPDARRIAQLEEQARQIVAEYQARPQASDIQWTRKTKGRAGEREILVLRAQIAAAAAVFLIIVGFALIFVYRNTPEIRLAFEGASRTPRPPTSTPTNTPTNTPGFTPTPSPTRDFTQEPTFTPSATINPFIPAGRVEVTLTPTDLFLPAQANNAIIAAAAAIDSGQYATAFPLAATERAAAAQVFNPNPYYYEVRALLGQGEDEQALAVVQEGQQRLDEGSGVRQGEVAVFQPLISLALAEVYLYQAQEAGSGSGFSLAAQAIEQADIARQGDPRYERAYIISAQASTIQNDFDAALDILNEGLSVEGLTDNHNLILQRGLVYFAQGERQRAQGDTSGARASFDRAAYQAYTVIYIEPYNTAAHRLQVQTALALGDPGLAVIYSLNYLFYFPDSAEAFTLLGQARTQEGNDELALEAYIRALNVGSDDTASVAQAYLARAALYERDNRVRQALEDVTAAYELQPTAAIRARRMQIALAAGDYVTARDDAEAISGSGVVQEALIQFVRAAAIIELAEPDDTDAYNEALTILNTSVGGLGQDQTAAADEYRARAFLVTGSPQDALNAIQRSIQAVENGSRRLLRAQIREQIGDYGGAIADYEWVLTYHALYNFGFVDQARQGIARVEDTLIELAAQATATAQTATAAADQSTATQAALDTATAMSATETAGPTATVRAATEIAATETAAPSATIRAETEAAQTATRATATAIVRESATARAESQQQTQAAQTATRATATQIAGETATARAESQQETQAAQTTTRVTATAASGATATARFENTSAAATATQAARPTFTPTPTEEPTPTSESG